MERFSNSHYSSKRFLGACIDNGAQRTVCGLKQARAYCSQARIPLRLRRSPFAFKFGNSICDSMGCMEFRIPLPNAGYLPVQADIVDADVPLLMGLDYLDKERLLADNLRNKLVCSDFAWELLIVQHSTLSWTLANWNLKSINGSFEIVILILRLREKKAAECEFDIQFMECMDWI